MAIGTSLAVVEVINLTVWIVVKQDAILDKEEVMDNK